MSWENPTDIEMGACQRDGRPWPETECEECDYADEGKPDTEADMCVGCIHNPANDDLECKDCLWDGFKQREPDEVEPIEPDDDYYYFKENSEQQ